MSRNLLVAVLGDHPEANDKRIVMDDEKEHVRRVLIGPGQTPASAEKSLQGVLPFQLA